MFYLDLFSALDLHKVEYVLIGGSAVALHGIMLASIDDLIALKQSVARPIDLADIEHLKRLQNL